jgi:hypothetical protein
MFDIENWDKDHTYKVMRELLYSFNFMWFLQEGWVQENCPKLAEGESFQRLSEDFGAYQAKRIERILDDPGKGVDRLVAFLRHSHWFAFEDIDLFKVSESELRMRTLNCTAQKAAKKWGMDCYDCSESGRRLRQGFFAHVDPTAEVTRTHTPPDKRPPDLPDDVSCEWRITIDSP